MSVLALVIALAAAYFIGWQCGRTSEWIRVQKYLKGQGVEDWIVTGVVCDEHHEPPSKWAERPSRKDRSQ